MYRGSDSLIWQAEAIRSGVVGTVGDGTSPSLALLVKKLTGQAGRASKGRFFIPGILRDIYFDNSGRLGGAEIVAFQSSCVSFFNKLNEAATATEARVIPHVLHNVPKPPAVLQPPTQILGFQLDPRIASQRRRLR
jgi:hypothetical protein